jgi:hypothetical protein
MRFVILSGEIVSRSETISESKDPGNAGSSSAASGSSHPRSDGIARMPCSVCGTAGSTGVLRLRETSLRELSLRSG